MSVNVMSPIFKFTTIRNPKITDIPSDEIVVMPSTVLVEGLISINSSSDSNSDKIIATNTLLQNYINSDDFIKTTKEFYTKINVNNANTNQLKKLYDNIIVRTLTKSNTNDTYGLIIQFAKKFAAELNTTVVEKIRITIPESITFSFTGFESNNVPSTPDNYNSVLAERIKTNLKLLELLEEAKEEGVISFELLKKVKVLNVSYLPLLQDLGLSSVSSATALTTLNEKLLAVETRISKNRSLPQTDATFTAAKTKLSEVLNENVELVLVEKENYLQFKSIVEKAIAEGITDLKETIEKSMPKFDFISDQLAKEKSKTLDEAFKEVNSKLNTDFGEIERLIPFNRYSLIGGSVKDVTKLFEPTFNVDEGGASINVYSNGCYLKYPIVVADLRVIEQQTVGYIPGEIAHISNTQKGEYNERVTRRLKSVESFESLIEESELTKETDTQSSERFSIEKEAFQVQQEENSLNVNASVSASYGPISATVNGGYSNSNLEVNGNSSSMNYAKDIFTRVTDRASNRTRVERSTRTIEEFEETVTHKIDNTGQETKSYVYRWLNKLVRGTLKNYGKRLIFQIDIAHPAHYYLSRLVKEQPLLNLPQDPRELKLFGTKFSPNLINPSNYLSLGMIYNVNLEAPPVNKLIISDTFKNASGSYVEGKLIPITKGYRCKKAVLTYTYGIGWPGGHQIRIIVGNAFVAHYNGTDNSWTPLTMLLKDETDNLPVSIMQGAIGFILNIEVECEPTPEFMLEWKVKCYNAILEGYDTLKEEGESKLVSFDFNNPGLNPSKKQELLTTELKKEAIRKMFRCNPFWANDNYEVGKEYEPDCCGDNAYAERVRFLESTFDWRNMTFEFHPYFYNNKNAWDKIFDLSDNDPYFEAFLKASYATIRIPVHRDSLKEIAACNFIINNSIGNYEVLPEGLQNFVDELRTEPVTNFTTDLDGVDLPEPINTIDLGIFPIPTSLVILECGNENGVSPIGFPQSEEIDPDVIIPKQYSPAIIANSCVVTPPSE